MPVSDSTNPITDILLQVIIDLLQELADNLVAIISFFLAHYNGFSSAIDWYAQFQSRNASAIIEEGVGSKV